MDTYDFIYQYRAEEEILKEQLNNASISQQESELIKSRIQMLQAAREMTYTLLK
jgi:hypothetical protein